MATFWVQAGQGTQLFCAITERLVLPLDCQGNRWNCFLDGFEIYGLWAYVIVLMQLIQSCVVRSSNTCTLNEESGGYGLSLCDGVYPFFRKECFFFCCWERWRLTLTWLLLTKRLVAKDCMQAGNWGSQDGYIAHKLFENSIRCWSQLL